MLKTSTNQHSNNQHSNNASNEQNSVLLIDANPSRKSILKRALRDNEFHLIKHISSTENLLSICSHNCPDIIVVGIDLPDADTLNDLSKLNTVHPHPVVMFAEKDTPQIINKAIKCGVNAYIVDDIQPQRIRSIITVAIARFQEHQKILDELKQTKDKLAQRKILEKAKGMLMTYKNMDEETAFSTIRKMAMNKGITLAQTAEAIIEVLSIADH